MPTEEALPERTFANESPGAVHIRQGTGASPGAQATLTQVNSTSLVVAVIALALVCGLSMALSVLLIIEFSNDQREQRMKQMYQENFKQDDFAPFKADVEARLNQLEKRK
jgi:cytochrome c-type biogenesis protein CcmH/NrfG